eukprot:15476966-Alexandrium_andersonii.AAC.1
MDGPWPDLLAKRLASSIRYRTMSGGARITCAALRRACRQIVPRRIIAVSAGSGRGGGCWRQWRPWTVAAAAVTV